MSEQNNRERLVDQVALGHVSVDEANVQMVRNERFRVVNKMPRRVRAALNKAVREGVLGHMKKDGMKPEVYYHPTFEYMAVSERNRRVRETLDALKKVCA